MAAPKGNKYNEKYDYKTAKAFFEDSLKKVKSDKQICYIGSLATKMNTYRQLYDYLLDRFKDLDTIKKEIDGILESRVAEKAMNNEVNSTFAIFMMKNNHGWKDKQESEHTGEIKITRKIIDSRNGKS
jgi:hypothetical protein